MLGRPFDLTPGSVNGEVDLSVLRLTQEWIDRGFNQVLAVRSTISLGLDAFGTTDDGSDRDAEFVAWLGQIQYLCRVFNTANQLLLRLDVQWTEDELLSLEQFSAGGRNTVRGYRENQLLRDRGISASAEFRLPVLLARTGRPVVQLVPFVDFGAGWNVSGPAPSPREISSAGIGVIVSPIEQMKGQVYWGYPFRRIRENGNDLQDNGLHFTLSFQLL